MKRTRSNGQINPNRLKLNNKFKGQFIKNSEFYSGNKNLWNKPCRSSTKVFNFYHKINIKKNKEALEREEEIRKLKEQEKHDIKKKFILMNKRLAKQNLAKRKIERVLIQKESRQLLEPHIDPEICKKVDEMSEAAKSKVRLNRSGFRSIFRALRDNTWNDLSILSEKNVKMVIPDKVIKKDESAIKSIIQKITDEEKMKEFEKLYFKKKHEEIYNYEKTLKGKNDSKPFSKMFLTSTMNNTLLKGMSKEASANESSLNENEAFLTLKSAFETKHSNQFPNKKDFDPHVESRLEGLHSTEILSGIPNYKLLDKEKADLSKLRSTGYDDEGIVIGCYQKIPKNRKFAILRQKSGARRRLYKFRDFQETGETTYYHNDKKSSFDRERNQNIEIKNFEKSKIPRAKSTSLVKTSVVGRNNQTGRKTADHKKRSGRERSISGRSHYLRTASQKILSSRKPHRKKGVSYTSISNKT